MLSAYSALNHGHRHPRIIKALIAQAKRVPLTSRAFNNDQLGPWLKELCELTGYEMALPMNHEESEAVHFVPELVSSYMRCPACKSPDFSIVRGRGIYIKEIRGDK